MASESFCAEASLSVGEPLSGTAAEASHFIVLEHAGAWGPKGVEDSGLPDALVSYLRQLGKLKPSLRVQLIRRGEGRMSREGAGKLFIAHSDERGAELFELPLPEPEQWPELGLEAWLLEGVVPPTAEARSTQLYLVCVHGKRDRCCALKGIPVYNKLRELGPEPVFQTTHLGGHRFAATLVVLPEGICYGRVSESEMADLRRAHENGQFHALSRVRGRMRYNPVVQAAEVALRERLSELRIDALSFVAQSSDGEVERVTFRHEATAAQHEVELKRTVLAPAPASCGAEPVPVKSLLALEKPRA